jgi:hypothetical protein
MLDTARLPFRSKRGSAHQRVVGPVMTLTLTQPNGSDDQGWLIGAILKITLG